MCVVTIVSGEPTAIFLEQFTQRHYVTTFPVPHKFMHGLEGLATFKANLVTHRIFSVVISTFGGIGAGVLV